MMALEMDRDGLGETDIWRGVVFEYERSMNLASDVGFEPVSRSE